MTITHEEISKRARQIWEREGRPEGRDKEHWLQAEEELRRESSGGQNGNNMTSQDHSMLKVSDDLKKPESKGKKNARVGKGALG